MPDDCNEKKYNRRYLKGKFLAPVVGLSLLWVGVTGCLLLGGKWTREALFKGAVLLVVCLGSHWSYKKVKAVARERRRQQVLAE